jgi:hypothetical protein
VFKIKGDKITKTIVISLSRNQLLPENSAWDTFGNAFNLNTIGKDFDIIKKCKAKYYPVFIQYDDFCKLMSNKKK